MKKITFFLLNILWCVSATAQVFESKNFDAEDVKTNTSSIAEVDNGKYNVKHARFEFSTGLNKDQFSLIDNNPSTLQNSKILPATKTINKTQLKQANILGVVGRLYSGSSFYGNVYYYLMTAGQVILGCPRGGLENFNDNKFCETNQNSCGTYTKSGGSLKIKWKNGSTRTGKIKANGDIDIDGSLIGEMQKVPVKLSAAYDFGVIMTGVSVAETTKFNLDGTYTVNKVGGVESRDGKNGAEWTKNKSGKYKINGFTITMIRNDGKTTSHTIYSMEKGIANPDYLGWDGNFLTKTK